jgi:hypothetical protein
MLISNLRFVFLSMTATILYTKFFFRRILDNKYLQLSRSTQSENFHHTRLTP